MYCIKIAFDKILSEPVFIGDSPKTFGSSHGRRFSKIGRIRMELRDIYTQLGGDYDVMLRRLRKDSTILMSVTELTDSLRGGRKPQADELFERVREDYRKTMDIIKKAVGD